MPVYEYLCSECGPFTRMRAMAEYELPSDCPSCEASCAARPADRAALLGRLAADAAGACDQRTQRRRAAHALLDPRIARRRLHLLLGQILAPRQARQRRHQELSDQPAVDDLALSCTPCARAFSPRRTSVMDGAGQAATGCDGVAVDCDRLGRGEKRDQVGDFVGRDHAPCEIGSGQPTLDLVRGDALRLGLPFDELVRSFRCAYDRDARRPPRCRMVQARPQGSS